MTWVSSPFDLHYSEWSDSIWVTTPTTPAPSTTVTQSRGGSVVVVGSTLEIQGINGNDWIEIQQTTTDLRFTLTDLNANTRYAIRVQEVATIDGRDILSRIAQLTARTLRLV